MVFLYIIALGFALNGMNSHLMQLKTGMFVYGVTTSYENLTCTLFLFIFCIHGLWNSWKALKNWWKNGGA